MEHEFIRIELQEGGPVIHCKCGWEGYGGYAVSDAVLVAFYVDHLFESIVGQPAALPESGVSLQSSTGV